MVFSISLLNYEIAGFGGLLGIFCGLSQKRTYILVISMLIQISPPNPEISGFNNGIQLTITLVTLL